MRTRWPRSIKASAVVRPPSPAPAMRTSAMQALFPPQAEHILNWPVGETGQHRFRGGAMAVRVPAWYDEDIARLPAEHGITDDRFAGTLDDRIDRAVSASIRQRVEPGRQQRHEGANCRHRRTAGRRIDVA